MCPCCFAYKLSNETGDGGAVDESSLARAGVLGGMLANLVFAVVVLADDFGEREGSAVILVDAAEEVVAACNSGDFDTASAQECCRMFLRVSPPTTRHLRNQKRWGALRCDRWRAALGSARTRNNDAAALEDAPVAWVKECCGVQQAATLALLFPNRLQAFGRSRRTPAPVRDAQGKGCT